MKCNVIRGQTQADKHSCLLGVVQFVFIRQTSCFHQLEVDTLWLNGINQVQNRNTAPNRFVLNREMKTLMDARDVV